MANVIPTLLAIEWLFSSTAKAELARSGEPSPSGEEDTIDVASLEEDINAIEVAILAAYQQDYNVSPMAPTIRLHSFTSPSIYMASRAPLHMSPLSTPWQARCKKS